MKLSNSRYQIALALRTAGKSYSEISVQTAISKSTLSSWFSKEKFSQKLTKELNEKWKASARSRILKMNVERKKQRELHYEQLRKEAREEYQKLKSNPLFLIGLSLYWGEGTKTHNGRVSLINSDPELLKIVVAFYRKVLLIPEEKIRAEMFIYQDHDEKSTKLYWSRKLRIEPTRFIKTQVLPSKATRTKRRMKNGLCTVYFSNTQVGIKILEWIKELAEECGNSSVG
jgi:hypothetical protein